MMIVRQAQQDASCKMRVPDIPAAEFARFVAESATWSELMRKCGYKNTGNRSVVTKRIEEMGLDASHIPTGQGVPAIKNRLAKKYKLEEILIENSSYGSMVCLRKRLQKELGWEHRCNGCKNTQWRGHPIPLEVEHKNGIHNDNRIQNLEFLCPNCHALTDTYKGKNVKNKVEKAEPHKCLDCGQEVTSYATRCDPCYKISIRTVERPPYDQLKREIEESGYAAVGRKYGVRDNTIRKWVKCYQDGIFK